MDNKYICSFINSKAIRKHLIHIGYQFTTQQVAYLIWQCKGLTLKEKHKEWENLIKTTDDCLFTSRAFTGNHNFHKLISDYIELEKKLVSKYEESEPGTVYEDEYWEFNEWRRGAFYDHFRKCNCWDRAIENGFKFRINKYYIDNPEYSNSRLTVYYNTEGEMMEIDLGGPHIYDNLSDYEKSLLNEFFFDMWFDFPVPFQKGDIVCDCFNRKPFVLSDIDPWREHEKTNRRPDYLSYKTDADMNATGYSFDNNTLSLHWDWTAYYYMNLDYFRYPYHDRFSGGERFLVAYSKYMKNQLDIDDLLRIYQIIVAEGIAAINYKKLDCYLDSPTKEILELTKYERPNND